MDFCFTDYDDNYLSFDQMFTYNDPALTELAKTYLDLQRDIFSQESIGKYYGTK
jgi:hypothetical protein